MLAKVLSTGTPDAAAVRPSVGLLPYGDESQWDEFVLAAPAATFFHLAGWRRVIEHAFGFRTYYLVAQSRQRISGVLPLTNIKSRLFGNRLVSNAFAMYGGPIAVDDETRIALEAEARRLMHELRVPVLEFRTMKPDRPDWATRQDLYVTFRKSLSPSVPENLKSIPSGQSTIIRNRAARNKLYSEIDDSINRFYPIYAESVRNLGTPVFSRRYFASLRHVFHDRSDIVTIMHGNKAVASALNIYFRDEVMTLYVGGTFEARALGANVFMFWEVMRRGCERGCGIFDFGRSKVGTGAYTFKRNWGLEPMPLGYQYQLAEGYDIPDQNPLNPKYRLLISAWKNLPLPIANLLGPPIVKGLG